MSKEISGIFKFRCGAELKNRVLMASMTIQAGYFGGSATSEMINYYRFRAGDASVIIVESCFIENHGQGFPRVIGIDNGDKILGLKRPVEAIQAKGSKAILQLYHAGRMANPRFNEGKQPISVSPIAALRPDAVPPREMTRTQINQMTDDSGEATCHAIEAGFDGVEIHGADTYLL